MRRYQFAPTASEPSTPQPSQFDRARRDLSNPPRSYRLTPSPSAGNGTASRILSTMPYGKESTAFCKVCSWPGVATEHAAKAHLSKPFPTSHAQHPAARASRVFAHLNHRSLHVHIRPGAQARHAPRQVLSAWHAPQCTPAGSTPTSSTTLQHSESAGTAQAAGSATRARALACWRAF